MVKTRAEIEQILGTENDKVLAGIRAVRSQESNHAERYNPYNLLEENALFAQLYKDFLAEKNPLADLLREPSK